MNAPPEVFAWVAAHVLIVGVLLARRLFKEVLFSGR